MIKRVVFLLCVGFCLLCLTASLAESVSLTAVVPDTHTITITIGEHGAAQVGDQQFTETASLTVQRFASAQIDIVPEYGYKLGGIQVSSGENLVYDGSTILYTSVVEDVFIQLSFVEMAWKKAVYTWSEDYSAVTAVRVSKDDPTVVITETAAAVGTVTKEPTCSEMGVTTYKATFEDHRFSTQRKKVENIEMIPHTPVTSPAVPVTDQENGIFFYVA